MNTCIYLRKSRKGDDPDETAAETLRRHREQLLALAQERGLNVVEIKEEIVSGGSIAARPQMRALLSEVEEGRYDAVLVMDIDRLGRGSMIDQGIIGKEKNTDKLLDAIEKSKENDAYKLLTGLGIPNVGKAAAKAIMKYFKDMDHLKEASVEQLTEVNDIGEVSALCIRNFFRDEKNIEILDRLKEYGVNMQAEETETVESVLTGKTVVVTGTLPTLGRKEASELIEKYGGKASGSVSKKTDYVLAGENAGSKLTKAQELGIPVISEEQLKEMLGI